MNSVALLNLTSEEKTVGVFVKGDSRCGEFRRWHSNGKIAEICFYKNEVKHGTYQTFTPNGEIDDELVFENDKPKFRRIRSEVIEI